MRLLTDLPAETIISIYSACSSVDDVLSLSETCKRFHALLSPSKKLPVLLSVVEDHAGPTFEIVQLLTANEVQAAHEIRQPPMSYSLLGSILPISYTAQEWQDIYPGWKWDENYADRRVLNSAEQHSLRRAIYRLWLFSRAFHNCNFSRETRLHPNMIAQRCRLLRAWSTEELAEIEDFRCIMRSVLESTLLGANVCPWELQPTCRPRHFQKQGAFLIPAREYLNSSAHVKNAFHTSYNSTAFTHHGPTTRGGWIDDITRFYLLEDLLKLDPEQVLCFRETAHLDMIVSDQTAVLGEEWFTNNGETFAETFDRVLSDRGENPAEIRGLIASGDLGIARRIDAQDIDQSDA